MRSQIRRVLRQVRLAPASATALLLASCASVGPNFTRPAAPSTPGYLMSGDAQPFEPTLSPEAHPSGAWWRALGSAELDGVMTQALRDNQTLAAAEASLDRARAELKATQGARAPEVSAAAGASREHINFAAFGFTGFPNPTISLYSVGGSVVYDMDIAGRARRRVEAAEAAQAAQVFRTDAAYLTLTGNVAIQSVRVGGLRDYISILQTIAAEDREIVGIQANAEAAGGSSKSSRVAGRAQLAQDEAALSPLRQELAQARHALALLVGQAPAQWSPPDFAIANFSPPERIPASLPSSLVRQRPDILASEADLHADTARVGVATADLYPDIKLSAGYTQSALTPGSLWGYGSSGWTFGPQLTAPIFNGGALRAQKRAAEAQARVSLAHYRQTVLTAFTQVADILTALANDDERVEANSRLESEARAGFNDAQAAYDIGGGARLAVVEAKVRLDRATLDRLDSQAQRLIDVVQLYAATSAAEWPMPVGGRS